MAHSWQLLFSCFSLLFVFLHISLDSSGLYFIILTRWLWPHWLGTLRGQGGCRASAASWWQCPDWRSGQRCFYRQQSVWELFSECAHLLTSNKSTQGDRQCGHFWLADELTQNRKTLNTCTLQVRFQLISALFVAMPLGACPSHRSHNDALSQQK